MKKYGDIIFFYLFGVFGGWDAKRECAEHKPPEGKQPGRDVPEHGCL